ncbi:MAG TPA: ADP-ribosylation factor-like protein [Candidatus Lokiarchaeia archaeon]|nr:ADP-ribosylation factor-like protein [Candidatus Lokiarchaeia archaeon]
MEETTQEPGKNGAKKILLLGLDNAGKTSIVNLVIKKIRNVVSIAPTKGVNWSEAEIFGQKIVIHDLGGQKKYKKKYIENTSYFDATDVMIFVIDLQDRDRYDIALEYFDKALENLDKLQLKPKLFVFLHKFDGSYIEEYKDVKTRAQLEYDQLQDSFMDLAKQHETELSGILQTSITDEIGCFSAFVNIWAAVVPRAVSIQEFLDKLVEDNDEIGIAIMSDAIGNVIAKNIRTLAGVEQYIDVATKSMALLLDWQKTIELNDLEHKTAIIEVEDQSIMIQRVESSGQSLYLMLYAVSGDYKVLEDRLAEISSTIESMI